MLSLPSFSLVQVQEDFCLPEDDGRPSSFPCSAALVLMLSKKSTKSSSLGYVAGCFGASGAHQTEKSCSWSCVCSADSSMQKGQRWLSGECLELCFSPCLLWAQQRGEWYILIKKWVNPASLCHGDYRHCFFCYIQASRTIKKHKWALMWDAFCDSSSAEDVQ